MNLRRIDHTAIAVRNMDEALVRFERLLGTAARERTIVPDQRVEVAFIPCGNTQLELVQPTDSDTGVARFLDARGESLHHIGIQVDNIRAELQQLAANGVELIDSTARHGAHGLVAFIHPRGTGGVLIELIQPEP
jgi:methylmalonyl-CoA/ethylmalonyl-CoA epimerase